ncbi:MAG: DUF72 domain-containing protein [Coriobacteriaceae bacterium]|nr:DUF72 domain-containing protein [Coriobacteriaceae bacterium]
MGTVRIGTCSWTEKSMVERWYPPGTSSPEAKLRYYAERFDTVEVDSTYYGMPRRTFAEKWAERTPEGFVFHVKAFGLMTQHSVDERALAPELRSHDYTLDERGRVSHPSAEMVDRTFELFLEELEPLSATGKLGGVLMQFPPYFAATEHRRAMENLGYIEYAHEKLKPARMLCEFRHPSWVSERNATETLGFLADRGISFVSVDAPQLEGGTTMPPMTAVTADLAYVRFHGRNRGTWHARTASAADRFDYLYEPGELCEWEAPIRELAAEADVTYAMFNNCRYDYAPRNAADLALILADIVEPRPGDALPGDPAHAVDRGSHPGAGQMDLGV